MKEPYRINTPFKTSVSYTSVVSGCTDNIPFHLTNISLDYCFIILQSQEATEAQKGHKDITLSACYGELRLFTYGRARVTKFAFYKPRFVRPFERFLIIIL